MKNIKENNLKLVVGGDIIPSPYPLFGPGCQVQWVGDGYERIYIVTKRKLSWSRGYLYDIRDYGYPSKDIYNIPEDDLRDPTF